MAQVLTNSTSAWSYGATLTASATTPSGGPAVSASVQSAQGTQSPVSRYLTDASESDALNAKADNRMSDVTIKDYVDAQDEKTRAMNEAGIARLDAKLDALSAGIAGLNQGLSAEISGMREGVNGRVEGLTQVVGGLPTMGTNVIIALTALGLGLAALAFGGTTFGLGFSVGPEITKVQQAQQAIDAAQDVKLDLILKGIEGLKSTAP